MRAWAAAAAAVVISGTSCRGTPVCTLAGCGRSVTVTIGPIADPARYAGSTLTLCLNERCADIAFPDEVPMPGTGTNGTVTGRLRASASLASESGDYRVYVVLDENESMLDDGDTYTLAIRDRDGAALLEQAWTEDYRESFPNGERCGPRCLSQTLALAAP